MMKYVTISSASRSRRFYWSRSLHANAMSRRSSNTRHIRLYLFRRLSDLTLLVCCDLTQ